METSGPHGDCRPVIIAGEGSGKGNQTHISSVLTGSEEAPGCSLLALSLHQLSVRSSQLNAECWHMEEPERSFIHWIHFLVFYSYLVSTTSVIKDFCSFLLFRHVPNLDFPTWRHIPPPGDWLRSIFWFSRGQTPCSLSGRWLSVTPPARTLPRSGFYSLILAPWPFCPCGALGSNQASLWACGSYRKTWLGPWLRGSLPSRLLETAPASLHLICVHRHALPFCVFSVSRLPLLDRLGLINKVTVTLLTAQVLPGAASFCECRDLNPRRSLCRLSLGTP